jgi:hypothetical protein
MRELPTSKIALVTYLDLPQDIHSDSYPQLKESLDVFLHLANKSFSFVRVYNRETIQIAYPESKELTADFRPIYSDKLCANSIKFPESWLEVGMMRWKPYLILDAIKIFQHKVDYIFYHDINLKKYPNYVDNISHAEKNYFDIFNDSDLVVFESEYKPLLKDCKRMLLDNFFGASAKTAKYFPGFWAGAIAVKPNQIGTQLIQEWCDACTVENCAPLPDSPTPYNGYKWHSQEQAVLSLLVYKWRHSPYAIKINFASHRLIFNKYNIIHYLLSRLSLIFSITLKSFLGKVENETLKK